MKKLPWKIVTFPDRSAAWLEAYIPHLQWTYVIEEEKSGGFSCHLFLNSHCPDSTPLHKRPVKNLRNAKDACLNHMLKTARGLQTFLNQTKPCPQLNHAPTQETSNQTPSLL